MRPEDVLTWLHATPFVPFRILMNSGCTYEVRYPELVRVLRTSLMLFTPSGQPDVYDRAEMLGLVLIEPIEPVTSGASAAP
jgi:hypothetical protein